MNDPFPLQVDHVTLGYAAAAVLEGIDLAIPGGSITALIGPNACGKSTLLRGLSRLLAPRHGTILLDGHDINRLPTRQVAQRVAMLPQQGEAPDGLTVRELAAFGRHPHRGWLAAANAQDEQIVAQALASVGLTDLGDHLVDQLSGGQRQRAWLAMALAQQAGILLLDEPTTFLDPAHQWEILGLIRELNRIRDCTVVMVLHDLTLAARFADRIVVIDQHRVAASGKPAEVLTAERIAAIYRMRADVSIDPEGIPLIVLRGLCGAEGPHA